MSLLEEIEKTYEVACKELESISGLEDLEKFRTLYLGKKGSVQSILKKIGSLSIEEKKTIGQKANTVSQQLEELYSERKSYIKKLKMEEQISGEIFDSLRPVDISGSGSLHPITKVREEVEDIFVSMGFQIMDGPEIETDYYNFGALNFTEDHPARDMQDTFYTEDGNLLRTHTSAIQARALKELKPPFRIIAPGRVFRYEEIDASHENTFNQVEGMVVGKDISTASLIYTMDQLLTQIFHKKTTVRLRPGYFPFVEPGFELDFQCMVCNGKGCSVCKQSGWVELLPCGLIHPNVLKAGGLDPEIWTGFAFGLGLDRLVMMRYGINDIRYFNSGNLRFLKKFA
ncbi:MAG: phenylalanine--tRNA ligase subunit alpha [Leptospiraceae bacterium]|nr:phenylalanine--tRNA ligase subunit alpha [Leptospiraceae bacterium]MCP5511324.1 phenylalanine--tRNA ligase subunit alpha [Leptospiraceae bacterium]